MRSLQLLACFISISVVCLPVKAQASRPGNYTQTSASQPAKNPEPGFSSSNAKDQQRAVAILRQILADSSQFEETFLKPVNILYLKYRVADLLWEQDPKLARRLFVESFRFEKHIGIARSAITQQKSPQAKRYLEEARQALKKVANQEARASLLVEIANAEAKLDSSRGFREMEATVELLNRIGWGEGNTSGMGPGGITLRMNSYDFSEGLVLLARADFSRALSLAKRMRQKEASAFALLAVCRGILRRE
jgi:hypothetical protein